MKTFILIIAVVLTSLAAQAETLTASYEVPTSQSELKVASIFKIRKLAITKDTDNTTSIKYLVPEELTGVKNVIEFSGVLDADGGKLISENGNLDCVSNSRQMMCSVTYQKLNFDSELAQAKLAQLFKGQELTNRISIQERFSTDPIGVIHIYFKNSSRLRLN